MRMFEDARAEAGGGPQVADIAEIIAEGMLEQVKPEPVTYSAARVCRRAREFRSNMAAEADLTTFDFTECRRWKRSGCACGGSAQVRS